MSWHDNRFAMPQYRGHIVRTDSQPRQYRAELHGKHGKVYSEWFKRMGHAVDELEHMAYVNEGCEAANA